MPPCWDFGHDPKRLEATTSTAPPIRLPCETKAALDATCSARRLRSSPSARLIAANRWAVHRTRLREWEEVKFPMFARPGARDKIFGRPPLRAADGGDNAASFDLNNDGFMDWASARRH